MEDSRVRYSVDGDMYDIPSDKTAEFETARPQARQVYRVGEETYAIPLDKREGFAAQHPDAQYYNGGYVNPDYTPAQAQQPAQEAQAAAPAPTPAPAQTEAREDGFFARLGRNLSQAESSPQGAGIPEPAVQQTQQKSELPADWRETSAEFDAGYDSAMGVINARLEERSNALREQSMGRERRMGRFLSSIYNAGQSENGAVVVPQAREEMQAGGDAESDELRAASQLYESAKRIKDAAYQRKGVAAGLSDSFRTDTWDFGVTDLKTARAVYGVAQKLERGEDLTENDNLLLDALVQNAFANDYYGGQLRRGYKAGQTTGESLPFMLEFIMNPLAGGQNAASGGAVKVLEKRLAKEIAKRAEKSVLVSSEKTAMRAALDKGGTLLLKGVARSADDLASAAGMAATTGSLRTIGDTYSRKTGEVQFSEDPDGGLQFDGFKGGENSFWKAAAKAYGATTIENFSEMFGNYFSPVGQTAKKGLYFLNKKMGLQRVNDFIDGIGAADWARAAGDFLERTDWNGPIGEFGEEIAGGIMNALTVGDQTLSASDPNGVFNKDNLVDTFLGVALFGGVVSALKTAGYRTQMQRNEAHMSKADNAGKEVFGARWNPIKAMIDEADEQSLGAIISRAFDPGTGYTPDQMFIIGEYANGRMTQLGLEKGRKKREDYISEGEEEGRALTDPADINRMDIDSKYATEKAAREDEDGNGASADAELGVEHAEAVMRGRRDAVLSNIEAAVGQPFWRSETTSREQGEPAQEDVVDVITYADGREVYVMSDDGQGNLATVDAEGKKGFISEAELQDGQAQRTSMPLETYLDIKVGQQNADAERQRMAKDAADNLKAVQQHVQQEGRINVGTPEAEQMATVVAVDPAPNGGVTVQVEGEAQPRVVSWAEAAQSLDMPLAPKSNDEIVAERIDAEEETQRYNGGIAEDAELVVMMDGTPVAYQFRRAENIDGDVIIKAYDPSLGEEVDLTPEMVTNLGDLLNGGTPAMPVADVDGNPVPEAATPTQPVQIYDDEAANELGIPQEYAYTTKRGAVVVDGSRLWAENPALWAQWNDRNQNRVIPTREYLEGKLAEIGNEVQEARQNLEAEARGQQNPDRMDELQQVLDKKVARQREISGLAARYESTEQAAAEAAAPVAEEAAAAQAETAAPVMEEQTPADAQPSITAGENATAEEIIASTQAVLDAIAQQPARNEEERRNAMEAKAEALQQMYDALGAKNTVVTTMAGLVDTMKAAGASERTIAAVENKLEELRASRGTLEGFYDRGTDTIFMVADGLQTAEYADRINIHESKHYENARTQAHRIALSTGISRQEMVSVMRRYKRTNAYDADTRVSLSDEVLAVSAEIAEEEGIEAIPDRLRELGVTNEEFINFVKNNVDNGRRNGQRRHLERRAPLQPSVAEGIGGQDGRNRIAEPGDVGGSRIRPDERSEEGARSGEPAAEPAPAGESGEQPGTVELAEEPSADTASEEALMHEISAGMDGRMDVDGQNTPVNFSVTSIAGGAGLAATEQDESGNVAFVAPDGRIFNGRNPLTVADVKGDGNNILSYMMQDALRYGTITPERAETIWQKYTDTLNRMLAKGLAENGGFDNLSSQWQWVGETVYKTIHDNSDAQYKHSIDITRVCKKNEAVIKAISALQRRLGYGITPGQVLDIYRSSIEEGYQVPCPVCYVFSRYIGNGYIATIAINGQKKYGAQLVDPATLSEEEKKERVRFWVNELKKVESDNERHKKTIAKAKSDIQSILDEIDGLSRKALAQETPAKERNRLLRQIKALDRRYKAALNVVSQSNLAKWIKNFAIHEVKGEWQLYDDTFQGMPAEYALDIRLTADAIRKYPGIQRMRKSLGSAGGKVIQFAADNTLGDVPMLLGHKENENAPNYYQMAVDAKSDEERASLLKKASEQFGKAVTYSQQQSLRGGQRMWSWSDNIERLAPDVFVNLMQEEMLGSALQSYSKQLEGINLVATMGGYVNGSLMGKGIGYQDVTEDQLEIVDGREVLKEDITDTVTEYTGEGTNERTRVLAQAGSPVFSDGTRRVALVFDDIVGIDAYGRDGKKGLFSLNQKLDKAGNILVGMDDTHIRAAMADDRVFFIIPWHASGMSSHILTQMMDYLGVNMDGVKPQDYTSVQEEKEPKDGVVSAELAAFWEAHRTDYPSAFNIPSGRNGRLSQEQIDYRNLRDAIFDGRVEGNQQFMDAIARDEFLSQVYRKVKERVSEGKMTGGDKQFIYPYEYWDETSTYDTADVNGNRYLEYCRRLGIQPKFVGQLNDKAKKRFGNFADEKGYWKLLIDRRMYDTAGRFQDLTPVSTDNYTPDLVDPEITEQEFNVTKVADDAGVERIADRTMATEEKRPGGIATVDYDMDLNSAVRAYESLDEGKPTQKLTPAQRKALEFVNGTDEQEGPQFSVSEDSQRIFDAAKERFGTTRDIREAGYVLPDGEMLDFSGRHELAPGSDSSFLKGGRTVDHREVESLAWDREGNEKTGIDTSMPDFIRRGAIRIDNNAGTINLAVKPTIDQRYVLQRLIENNDGTVDVDFGDGWDSNHYVSYDGAKSARVINDIKRYFDEGVEPEGGISFSLRGIVGAAEDATAMVNLDTAKEMEAAGKDTKAIWLATGWERGKDGKWRNEIPDATPKMFPVGKRKLTVGDIIDAPEIFASYPEIRDYKVTLKKISSAGSFFPSRKEIELDSEYNSEITIREEDKEAAREYFAEHMRKDPTRPATLRKEMEKKFGVRRLDIVGISTVTHELQHAIQEIEGFAKGGNSAGQAQDFLDKVYKDYPNVVNFLRLFSTRNTKAKLLSFGPAKIRSAVERGITDAEGEVRRRMEELRDYLTGIDDWKYRGLVNAAELLKSRAQQAGKAMYNSLVGEVEARNAERRRSMSEEERRNTPPSETEDVSREEQLVRFSVVTDPAKIEELENGEKELGYRTVTMNEDGSFGSPKASKLGKKGEKSVKTSSFELGQWEQAEENPQLATEDGKINLADLSGVDYNPYIHIRPDAINKQFTSAWRHPEQVYIQTAYPTSELSSGYHADKAKLPVGRHAWTNGDLILSRWDKPERIVPWEEVADAWEQEFKDTGVTFDIVSPHLLPILAERGVEILPPKKAAGKPAMNAYERWKKEQESPRFSVADRYGNPIGDGSWHVEPKVIESITDEYPQVETRVDRSNTTESSYVTYTNRDNGKTVQVRFSNHMSNAERFGDVLPGYASELEILHRLGLADREFVPDPPKKYIWMREISKKDAASGKYEEADKTTQELYDLPAGQDLSEYTGKLAKGSRWLILGDSVDEIPSKTGYYRYTKKDGGSLHFSIANDHQEIFVSNAQRAVEGIRQDKATPDQWLKMIEKGGGLKAGEDKWLGLSDWLKGQDKKSITKQEILDYINENKIQIEEQPYSENVDLEEAAKRNARETIADGKSIEDLQAEIDELKESPQRYDFVGEDADSEELDDYLMDAMVETYGDDFRNAYYIEGGVIDYYDINPYDVDEDDAADLTGENGERKINSTRLSYTTEGLENKREIALTVPTIEPWSHSDNVHFGDAGEGRAIAWVRFGDAESEDGKILFIDEIQSKRHQEGREHGYKDQKAIAALQDKEDEAKKAYDDYIDSLKEKYGGFDGMAGNLTEEENQRAEELNDAHIAAQNEVLNSIGSIPAAPFEKNWHELAMKRMLRLAAEEGYDYVAWTTGEQQVERYNLSNQVSKIEIGLDGRSTKENPLYEVFTFDAAGNVIDEASGMFNSERLGSVFGKELATRLAKSADEKEGMATIDGEGLKIGGEGMKGFYDDILPRFMNKYGKKWGVKVADITLPGLEHGNLSAHAVPVTQEMKDSVMEGQLMFSTSGEEQTNRQMLIEQAEKGGLGAVIGENGVAELYREAYASIPKEELKKIVERGLAEGGNVMGQLKAYLHEKAKQGTENDETGLLFKLFDDIRFVTANPALTDADIRWMLFKETSSARADDLLALAEERAMKNRWGVGAIPQEQQFQEATRQASEDVAQRMEDAEKTREEAKTATASESVFSGEERSILNELKTIDKAMAGQQAYDKATVDSIVKFAREILKNGKVSALTLREVTRLLSLVNNAAGKSPKFVTRYADQLMDMLLDHVVADEKAKFMKLVKVNASKVSDSGVEVQGKLDVIGQAMIKAFRENMDSDVEDIRRRLEEVSDRITDKDDAIREEAQAAYQGLMMALQYKENIKENEASYKDLKDEFDDVGTKLVQLIGRKSYEQFITESKDALRKNRLERVDMYRDLSAQIADVIKGGAERAKAFREEQKKRVEDIHHDANRDMQGTPAREHLRDGRLQRFLNSDFVHFFAKSLATADQMFRLIGRKSVTGEGWLFNRLIKNGFTPCRDAAIRGLREATDILDRKASEVFGKKMRWSGIYDIERKMKGMTVTFLDGGEMVDHDLTQGNMLYIYMANKMADGRMKLRKMGISEEDVAEIKRHIDPRFIELADWMQNEFYVNLRNKYNAVHERMFGAPMAAIDDYVPLKILSNARFEDVDLGNNKSQAELSSEVTGSIIKRRKNSLALDILNTDAFSLAIEHVQKMEDWAAFAEFRRDMNTLLSYKRFRNQIQNMNTIYGSGETLWQTFSDACSVITGNYKPKVRRGDIDRIALNVSKGVTGAKIAFRVNTALKQILSFPAYFSDARPDFLAKSLATPGKSWKWCMENLPMFEDRWKGRIAGDTRLMNTDSSWAIWKNKMVERLSRWGMTPNAFIDATTVAIGSKAMYDTKRARYLRDGYSEEKADEMARRDAEILYNQTQQSSENAFVAPVQLDRTVMAVTLTTYRNSSMAYQRQLHDAIRSLRRMLKPGYREQSIEFMKRQHMENGLTEEQAELAAGREYNRQWYRNLVRVAMFGYGLQFLWKIGNNMWYLLFGDDDDEKQKILEDAALAELAGPVEGLVGGNVISDAWAVQASKLVNARYGIKQGNRFGGSGLAQLPIESDMDNIMSLMDYDKVRAINGIIDLVAQSVSGVNPQTITDIVVAVIDACNGNLDTATEAALLAMRILQMPQSTIDKFMIDEIDMSAADARKLSVDELARRYAEYKVRRNAPLTGWSYDDETREKRFKSQEKAFREKVKQRMQLKEGTEEEVPETTEEAYERITKAMQDIGRPVNQAKRDKDTLTMNMLMAQPQYEQYLIFKRYQKEINKLKRSIDNTQDDALREQWTAQREELIRKMKQEIENNQ